MSAKSGDVECPMGDPRVRGHPSLEELTLFTPFAWHWIVGEGWLIGEMSCWFGVRCVCLL